MNNLIDQPYLSISRDHHEATLLNRKQLNFKEDARIYWSHEMKLYFGIFRQKKREISVIMCATDLLKFTMQKYKGRHIDMRLHYPSTFPKHKKDALIEQEGDYDDADASREFIKYLLLLS